MGKIILKKEKLHSGHAGFKMGHDLAFDAISFALNQWHGAGGPKDGMSVTVPDGLPAGKYMLDSHSAHGDEIEFSLVPMP